MVPHGLKEWTRILRGSNHSATEFSFHKFLLENDIFCTGENIIGRMEVCPPCHTDEKFTYMYMYVNLGIVAQKFPKAV